MTGEHPRVDWASIHSIRTEVPRSFRALYAATAASAVLILGACSPDVDFRTLPPPATELQPAEGSAEQPSNGTPPVVPVSTGLAPAIAETTLPETLPPPPSDTAPSVIETELTEGEPAERNQRIFGSLGIVNIELAPGYEHLIGSRCTGFYIGGGFAVTAGHCFGPRKDEDGQLHGTKDSDGNSTLNPNIVIDGKEYNITHWSGYVPEGEQPATDIMLLTLDVSDGEPAYGLEAVATSADLVPGAQLLLGSRMKHPDGTWSGLSIVSGTLTGYFPGSGWFSYLVPLGIEGLAECYAGRSGSPVMNAEGQVIGVHLKSNPPVEYTEVFEWGGIQFSPGFYQECFAQGIESLHTL